MKKQVELGNKAQQTTRREWRDVHVGQTAAGTAPGQQTVLTGAPR